MKSLKYFEAQARELKKENIDYNFVSLADLTLSLMKQYRKENNISWVKYKPIYDKWFARFHN